jgi:hypothetical protein
MTIRCCRQSSSRLEGRGVLILGHSRCRMLDYISTMSTMQKAMIAGFTAAEQDYIRRELDQFFSTLPTVADGFMLKTWRSGPHAGQPKVPLPAKGLVERGLMRIDTTQRWPRLLFTETGLVALRTMMTDRRLADRKRYAHIRQELGIPSADGAPPGARR